MCGSRFRNAVSPLSLFYTVNIAQLRRFDGTQKSANAPGARIATNAAGTTFTLHSTSTTIGHTEISCLFYRFRINEDQDTLLPCPAVVMVVVVVFVLLLALLVALAKGVTVTVPTEAFPPVNPRPNVSSSDWNCSEIHDWMMELFSKVFRSLMLTDPRSPWTSLTLSCWVT